MNRLLARMLRSAALLGLVAVLGTGLLAWIEALTRDRIAAQERRVMLEQLHQVLPARDYDNALHEDVLLLNDPQFFRHREPVRVYRARRQGEPVAVVMGVTAPDGYNGDIRMLVGIRRDGTLSGVRVTAHRETPGLGDPIERERSDWVLDFDGRSLGNPPPGRWAVQRDGGDFEQFTGATITPRAVVEAVQRALDYHATHAGALYRPAPATEASQ